MLITWCIPTEKYLVYMLWTDSYLPDHFKVLWTTLKLSALYYLFHRLFWWWARKALKWSNDKNGYKVVGISNLFITYGIFTIPNKKAFLAATQVWLLTLTKLKKCIHDVIFPYTQIQVKRRSWLCLSQLKLSLEFSVSYYRRIYVMNTVTAEVYFLLVFCILVYRITWTIIELLDLVL